VRSRFDVMEEKSLHERLVTLREAARDRAERIRERIEWVEERQRELWSRLDRESLSAAPVPVRAFEEPAARPAAPAAPPREDRRPRGIPAPSLAPRPAEVLLAHFRDLLRDTAADKSGATNDRPALPELVSAEP